jgi:hypothetical protein
MLFVYKYKFVPILKFFTKISTQFSVKDNKMKNERGKNMVLRCLELKEIFPISFGG